MDAEVELNLIWIFSGTRRSSAVEISDPSVKLPLLIPVGNAHSNDPWLKM